MREKGRGKGKGFVREKKIMLGLAEDKTKMDA
jgi:hypothetical protein